MHVLDLLVGPALQERSANIHTSPWGVWEIPHDPCNMRRMRELQDWELPEIGLGVAGEWEGLRAAGEGHRCDLGREESQGEHGRYRIWWGPCQAEGGPGVRHRGPPEDVDEAQSGGVGEPTWGGRDPLEITQSVSRDWSRRQLLARCFKSTFQTLDLRSPSRAAASEGSRLMFSSPLERSFFSFSSELRKLLMVRVGHPDFVRPQHKSNSQGESSQAVVAFSSAEAELYGVAQASAEAVGWYDFVGGANSGCVCRAGRCWSGIGARQNQTHRRPLLVG